VGAEAAAAAARRDLIAKMEHMLAGFVVWRGAGGWRILFLIFFKEKLGGEIGLDGRLQTWSGSSNQCGVGERWRMIR
jgi:hypothetical protein